MMMVEHNVYSIISNKTRTEQNRTEYTDSTFTVVVVDNLSSRSLFSSTLLLRRHLPLLECAVYAAVLCCAVL